MRNVRRSIFEKIRLREIFYKEKGNLIERKDIGRH